MAPLPKRKRSLSELSPAPSNPPQSLLPSLASHPPANLFTLQPSHRSTTSSYSAALRSARHLPSRTYKRIRGGRPAEDEVFRHTMNILFAAQKRQDRPRRPIAPATPSSLMFPDQDMVMTAPPASLENQQSLHHFWPSTSTIQPPGQFFFDKTPLFASNAGQDGGAGPSRGGLAFPASGDNEDAMDIDNVESPHPEGQTSMEHGCVSCEDNIPTDEKQCMNCARTKVWVGGIGWAEARPCIC